MNVVRMPCSFDSYLCMVAFQVTFPFLFDSTPHVEGSLSSVSGIYTLQVNPHADLVFFFAFFAYLIL